MSLISLPALQQRTRSFCVILLFACSLAAAHPPDEKITPEELVAKHQAAIGAPDILASWQTFVAKGANRVTVRQTGTKTFAGQTVLASDGAKNFLGYFFDSADYPFDRLAYDGAKVSVSALPTGIRSTLGDFFLTFSLPIQRGLLGGILSTAWPLRKTAAQNYKLEISGSKKINGHDCYEVKYKPDKGTDLDIRFYFDKATFQLLHSSYKRTSAARSSTGVDTPGLQRDDAHFEVAEDFADFKSEKGLILPHSYKVTLTFEQQFANGTLFWIWDSHLTEFFFNQNIRPEEFVIAGPPPKAKGKP